AGEGDIVKSTERERDVAKFGGVVDATRENQVERRAQFFEQGIGFDELGFALAAPVDLAVDAVEVADLVRVQIDANRNPSTAPTQHRVHKPIVLEVPGVIGVKRKS